MNACTMVESSISDGRDSYKKFTRSRLLIIIYEGYRKPRIHCKAIHNNNTHESSLISSASIAIVRHLTSSLEYYRQKLKSPQQKFIYNRIAVQFYGHTTFKNPHRLLTNHYLTRLTCQYRQQLTHQFPPQNQSI